LILAGEKREKREREKGIWCTTQKAARRKRE